MLTGSDIWFLYLISLLAGFSVAEILTRLLKPKIKLNLFKKQIRLHHFYFCLPALLFLFIQQFYIASGFFGVALHDFYLHSKLNRKR